ncbi:hypothetical protein [Nonomuraea phyllanthi]|nr:hypothetical protein [Nonomuraea phyllanthi]
MKARVLTAAALALAAAALPVSLDRLTGGPPLVQVETWVQHINVMTS